MKTKKQFKTFVIRKIRNGKVKICGKWYMPDSRFKEYDGRLDGMKYLFGRYEDRLDLLALHSPFPNIYEFGKSPECIDGAFVWDFWKEKKET